MISVIEVSRIGYHSNKNVVRMEGMAILSWLDEYIQYKTGNLFFDLPVLEVDYEEISNNKDKVVEIIANNTTLNVRVVYRLLNMVLGDSDTFKKSDLSYLVHEILKLLMDTIKPLETTFGNYKGFRENLIFVLRSFLPNTRNLYESAENYGLIKDVYVWYRLDENGSVPITLVEEEFLYTERKLKKILLSEEAQS